MATLDDKLLGEKLQNYCSSSSSEEEDNNEEDEKSTRHARGPKFIPEAELKQGSHEGAWKRGAQNTGPKGVIKDWQRYKQLEQKRDVEAQQERLRLANRLAMTCVSDDINKEDLQGGACSSGPSTNDKKTAKVSQEPDEIDNDLMDDEFLQEYIKKRMEELQKKQINLPRFGKVIELTGDKYLNEIDNENKSVTILIHIYDQKIPECNLMNDCLDEIASLYAIVKICRIKSTEINLSEKFRKIGCPALLIYKNTELIGNFVKMIDEFGSEFTTSDVESFLIEQGYLPSEDVVSKIRTNAAQDQEDSDD